MTPNEFAKALLSRLGLPQSDNNVQALVAVQKIEAGHSANSALFNPMNTMQPMPGARDAGLQVKGIKAYSNWDEGLEATARTLESKRFDYSGILKSLSRSAAPDETIKAWAKSPWGWTSPVAAASAYQYYGAMEFPIKKAGELGFSTFKGIEHSFEHGAEAIKELFTFKTTASKVGAAVVGVGLVAGVVAIGYVLFKHHQESS